jgi:type IV pilus assembly protein PilV
MTTRSETSDGGRGPQEPSRLSDSSGITILEVLLGVTIFTVGLLAVGAMQLNSVNTNMRAKRLTHTSALAGARMEQLMALPFTHAELAGSQAGTTHSPGQGADGIDNDEDGLIDENGEAGTIGISWTVTDNDTVNNTKHIAVTLGWSDRGGQRSLTLDCLKARDQ